MSGRLSLEEYQSSATSTDRTASAPGGFDLPILGLFGETGSLLSEVKKMQRDTRTSSGYEDAVLEEMGDVLWYLAIIAVRAGIGLPAVADRAIGNMTSSNGASALLFVDLQPQHFLPMKFPTIAFERTLLQLAGAVGKLASLGPQNATAAVPDELLPLLAEVLSLLTAAANEAGVSLEDAARQNIAKAADRWPSGIVFPPLFDEKFPEEEQLPRLLAVDIFERVAANGKHYVVQRCNGIYIGDRLTDNIVQPDDYRFHDVFHYAYAAVLGWSPVTRALLRLKRKSETKIDEGQDGARAILIEEGVATYVFGEAKNLDFFAGLSAGELSFSFLKSVRQFARGYEADTCPLWLWERAILQGNEAFRFLKANRRGRIIVDLGARELRIAEMPA